MLITNRLSGSLKLHNAFNCISWNWFRLERTLRPDTCGICVCFSNLGYTTLSFIYPGPQVLADSGAWIWTREYRELINQRPQHERFTFQRDGWAGMPTVFLWASVNSVSSPLESNHQMTYIAHGTQHRIWHVVIHSKPFSRFFFFHQPCWIDLVSGYADCWTYPSSDTTALFHLDESHWRVFEYPQIKPCKSVSITITWTTQTQSMGQRFALLNSSTLCHWWMQINLGHCSGFKM